MLKIKSGFNRSGSLSPLFGGGLGEAVSLHLKSLNLGCTNPVNKQFAAHFLD